MNPQKASVFYCGLYWNNHWPCSLRSPKFSTCIIMHLSMTSVFLRLKQLVWGWVVQCHHRQWSMSEMVISVLARESYVMFKSIMRVICYLGWLEGTVFELLFPYWNYQHRFMLHVFINALMCYIQINSNFFIL